jgi:hypothetical protein
MISSGELYFLILPSKSKQIMLPMLILLVSLKNSVRPCCSIPNGEKGRYGGPEGEPPLGTRLLSRQKGPESSKLRVRAMVAAHCKNDLPYHTLSQSRGQKQGCPLTFTPTSTVADLHRFEPQNVGKRGHPGVVVGEQVERFLTKPGHARVPCHMMLLTEKKKSEVERLHLSTFPSCRRTSSQPLRPLAARRTPSLNQYTISGHSMLWIQHSRPIVLLHLAERATGSWCCVYL